MKVAEAIIFLDGFVGSWAIAVNSGFVCCGVVCFTFSLMSFSRVLLLKVLIT